MKIKTIKKTAIIAVIISLLCVINFPIESVNAENGEKYLRIITESTPFYQDREEKNLLFYLPYSYYIKVLSNENGIVHAEIGSGELIKIDGYIPQEILYEDDKEVINPYPFIIITSARNTVLYEDSELKKPLSYIFSNRTMTYYGNGISEEPSYYVSFNGNLGYVKESDLMPFTIPNHPNPLFEEKTDDTLKKPSDAKSVTILRILIIASLGLAGIIGLIFSLRKKPTPNTAITYYDEENEE